ncbi:hypothetical protein [Coleofasciculus sp. E1-EBD-02]|jgi:hypothetical protein|uniref:hypothetical protein n=1 Tax=Coleofasciculus sp. E1-EBD-02 TaxID=3068481 RepID=UPI0040636A08
MAHLHEILSSILIDITKAQHAANVFSRQLSKQYKDDKLLRSFPIPNALISTIDLTLRYGVSEDLVPPPNSSVSDTMLDEFYPSRNLFFKVGHLSAAVVLNKVTEELKDKDFPEELSEPENRLKILEALRSEKIRGELGNEIGESLNQWYRFLRSANEEELDSEEEINRAIAEVKQTVSAILLSNINLKQQLSPENFTGVFEDYQSNFWRQVDAFWRQLIAQLFTEIRIINSLIREALNNKALNVFAETNQLKKLPEHSLQLMNIKIELQNYKCVVIEPGDEEELVPED